MYKVSETVLPIYINGHSPIIKTCSDVTLNLSSKDSIVRQWDRIICFGQLLKDLTVWDLAYLNLLWINTCTVELQ